MIYFLRHDDKLTPDKLAFQITVWFKFVFAYIYTSNNIPSVPKWKHIKYKGIIMHKITFWLKFVATYIPQIPNSSSVPKWKHIKCIIMHQNLIKQKSFIVLIPEATDCAVEHVAVIVYHHLLARQKFQFFEALWSGVSRTRQFCSSRLPSENLASQNAKIIEELSHVICEAFLSCINLVAILTPEKDQYHNTFFVIYQSRKFKSLE